MTKCYHRNVLNRHRVHRFREAQANLGRVRLEVYVDRELADAIHKLCPSGASGRRWVVEDLLRVGLRLEGVLEAPRGFWVWVDRIAERYR